jgi:hypothetical protein
MHIVPSIALAIGLALGPLGCGRVDPGGPDGSAELPDAEDLAPDATSADAAPPLGPWSSPARVAVLSTDDHVDSHPSVRGDGLEMYFVSDRDGYQDLYVSRRFARSEPWSAPQKVVELDALASVESGPDVSDDGKTLWFARGEFWVPDSTDLYVARRDTTSDPWGEATLVTELSTAVDDLSPHVTADGRTMYFASAATGDYEIYRSTRPSAMAEWGGAQLVPRLNSPASEESTSTTGDGLEMYIDSRRDGPFAIYRSTKAADGGPWSFPEAVPELAGGSRADVTADGRYMVLSMPGGTGFSDIYEAWR